jgi:hypothetical protein
MDSSILIGLINNAALLVALGVLYDLAGYQWPGGLPWVNPRDFQRQVFSGLFIGVIGLMVMLTPWQMSPGILIDTRTVLLSLSGLFFGAVPSITWEAQASSWGWC